jgi:hypothetical protein
MRGADSQQDMSLEVTRGRPHPNSLRPEARKSRISLLRVVNLIVAVLVLLAPAAHVLEMPNKLALDAPLWLAVQQHLYRGWGPVIGAPTEILALATTLALVIMRRRQRATMRLTLAAAVAYAGMLAAFFAFNNPVNAALNAWTPASIPPDWQSYRMRWEIGHALAAALSVVALVCVARAWLIERDAGIASHVRR